jgi:hypothetical protein
MAPFKSAADRAAFHAFFRDRPLAQSLFEKLQATVGKWGPVELVATKSRVAFVRRTRFLWVHQATDDGIWLGFLLPEHVPSPRLRTGPAGKRWSHHTRMTQAPDAELQRWLKAAWKADGDDGKPARPPPRL